MYHPHFDEMTQINLGMHGFFVIHPRDASARRIDRDFAIFLNEQFTKPGTATPDPTVMLDFNSHRDAWFRHGNRGICLWQLGTLILHLPLYATFSAAPAACPPREVGRRA